VFGWRRIYLSGRLREQKPTMKLLPVRVSESLPPVTIPASNKASTSIEVANPKPIPGTIHIKLRQAQLRIAQLSMLLTTYVVLRHFVAIQENVSWRPATFLR